MHLIKSEHVQPITWAFFYFPIITDLLYLVSFIILGILKIFRHGQPLLDIFGYAFPKHLKVILGVCW